MPANVQFKRGLLANLPQSIIDGTIYVTTDEHAMYVDHGNQRLRLGDFIPVDTVQDLPAAGHAYETAVYYVRQGNILARWDADATNNGANARWIQINKAGVVGVRQQNGSSGNVITGIETATAEDGTLQLLITKATVTTSEDFADLRAKVTTLENDVEDIDDYITVLQGDSTVQGSLAELAATVEAALKGGETQYTTLKALGDQLRSLSNTVSLVSSTVSDLQSSVSNLTTTVNGHTTQLTTLTGDASVEGSIAQQVAAEATARQTADNALDSRVTLLESTASDLSSSVSDHENRLDTLEGSGTGSVRKTVDDAIAAIVANAPSDFDTLKEISDWISSHANSAATMNSQISTLQSTVSDLSGDVNQLDTDLSSLTGRVSSAETNITNLQTSVTTLNGNSTVIGSVDQKISQATSLINSNLSDLADRVSANEDAIETLNGDANTAGSVDAKIAVEAAARQAADTALDTRLTTAESTISTHTSQISTLQTSVSDLNAAVSDHTDRLTWKEFS